jgi:replicative DNA helicase
MIASAEEALRNSQHLHLLDGSKSVEQLWSYAARLRDRHGLAAVFIDQFDKLSHTAHKGLSKEQIWAETSARLFAAMRDTGCPWFVLAQLGIKNQKEHPRPSAWHIRDCSQLIQDCDRAYVVDRPQAEPERWEALKARAPEEAKKMHNAARITLEKNRNGLGGLWSEVIPFSRACGRFGDLAPADAYEQQDGETVEWAEKERI